jgi:hypothetical protein
MCFMAVRRRLAVALILLVTGATQARSQTPPPPPPPQQQPPQPQQPTTTVVGPEGRLVSLIFPRADAENVTRRIYGALLAREPNPQEFADSVGELQRGQLQQRLAAMVQEPEFTGRAGAATPAQMLDQVFQGMLDRAPTAAEQKTYLPQIQARQYAPAMVKLITSDSFRKQAARDRATAAAGAPSPATPTSPTATGRSTGSPPPASTAPPTPRVTVPPPPPLPPVTTPPSTPPGTGQTPPAGSASPPPPPSQLPAARPPLRPAPFPTARNSEATMPLTAPARLTPEWTRVLACQEQVVAQVRAGQADLVLLRFEAAEVSASTVRGNAVDAFDDDRRLSYQCTGAQATFNYLDIRASRTTAPEDFPFEEVKACHTAVIAALKRNRRGAAVSFETAGMMPTDSLLFVRGVGIDQTRAGQVQPFTYQCQWDGDRVVSATFTLTSR